jgi:hypothetical protein
MPTKKRKSSPLHTMSCGCQYERLNWMGNPLPCRGRQYLYAPLPFNTDGKTAGQCTGTAHLKLVTTYDDLNGAKLCDNCSDAHICEHQPALNRIHTATLKPQPNTTPKVEPVVAPEDATDQQRAFVEWLNKYREEA